MVPYPLRAARLELAVSPFLWRFKPDFRHRAKMPEAMRAQGETIWWGRWLCLTLSYSRML